MDIILFNVSWMIYNISLALVAVFFGWLTFKTKSYILKLIFGTIWILFLPNTIYLLTDIEHYFEQIILVNGINSVILTLQYIVLMVAGIISFIISMYPLEIILKREKRSKLENTIILVSMNLLIAFGMVLGRVQRTNSWDVLFNSPRVVDDAIHVLITPELLMLFFFFALLCNIIYFPIRKILKKYEIYIFDK